MSVGAWNVLVGRRETRGALRVLSRVLICSAAPGLYLAIRSGSFSILQREKVRDLPSNLFYLSLVFWFLIKTIFQILLRQELGGVKNQGSVACPVYRDP